MRLLDQLDDLGLLGSGISHAPSSPSPLIAFFKQAVLQGQIGYLQGSGLTTKVLHLIGGCRAGRVPRQPALAGLKKLLGPTVIHRGGDALAATKLRDAL